MGSTPMSPWTLSAPNTALRALTIEVLGLLVVDRAGDLNVAIDVGELEARGRVAPGRRGGGACADRRSNRVVRFQSARRTGQGQEGQRAEQRPQPAVHHRFVVNFRRGIDVDTRRRDLRRCWTAGRVASAPMNRRGRDEIPRFRRQGPWNDSARRQ